MGQIIWTELARLSLQEVYDFYATKSMSGANNMVNGIIDKVGTLKAKHKYESIQGFPREYRKALYRYFKIIYRIDESGVIYIIDVVDGRQDPNQVEERSKKW